MIFTQKKSDLVDELFKSGVGFEAMPLDIVIEYAEADVKSCGEIYLDQLNDFSLDENASLKPILDLSNEMLLSLVSMERNGINVDRDAFQHQDHIVVHHLDIVQTQHATACL